MSVLKNDRTESDIAYYFNAIELRKDIALLLLRDFGVKTKVRSTDLYTKFNKIEEEDAKLLDDLIEKYHLNDKILEEYPEWMINHLREIILRNLEFLITSITQAHKLQTVLNKEQFYERQKWQGRALGYLEMILQNLQFAMDVLPIDANKLTPFIERIVNEEESIKRWRKKCNKVFNSLKD